MKYKSRRTRMIQEGNKVKAVYHFAQLVKKGEKKLEDCPERLRESIKRWLPHADK